MIGLPRPLTGFFCCCACRGDAPVGWRRWGRRLDINFAYATHYSATRGSGSSPKANIPCSGDVPWIVHRGSSVAERHYSPAWVATFLLAIHGLQSVTSSPSVSPCGPPPAHGERRTHRSPAPERPDITARRRLVSRNVVVAMVALLASAGNRSENLESR